jgi:phospholipid/cholesterol/gamma-HCH transport system ATP-binding protein
MQEAEGQFAIRVHGLVVGFRRHVVIDHLDLDVRRGEILGLVGASGGGKSVLMPTMTVRPGAPPVDGASCSSRVRCSHR